jgi:hypothetical protein
MELICVPPHRTLEIWPVVSTMIYRAMKRGGLSSFKSVEQGVLAGNALLWLAVQGTVLQAACVTELIVTEWQKTCVIVACGGADMEQWLHLISGLEQYAKDEGCSCIRIFGRKGWERKLKDYSAAKIVLEKELA